MNTSTTITCPRSKTCQHVAYVAQLPMESLYVIDIQLHIKTKGYVIIQLQIASMKLNSLAKAFA